MSVVFRFAVKFMTRAMHAPAAKGEHIIVNCFHLEAAFFQLGIDVYIVAHRQNAPIAKTDQITAQFHAISLGHRNGF